MTSTKNAAAASPALLSLAPTTLNEDELHSYDQQFNHVFSDPALRDIAVAGAPGSGKSTVMNSWKSANPNHGWLEVSLANFATGSLRPTPGAIEDALINQIVGKMDLRQAPKSRFRKSMERSRTEDLAIGLVSASFVALTIFLGWVFSLIPSSRPSTSLVAVAAMAWFVCLVFAFYKIGRTGAIGRVLKQLRISTGEIDLGSEETSPIQYYMSDLVYLFNASEYDSVIFDDLDSFDYLPLFQQLRQLNDLANSKRDPKRAPLRFFYLVNDSLFEDPHARAKFFDYIISVIPYIDPSNSLALFREGLKGVGIEASDEFLYELSLFIDDPRILRDLVNETHHYKAVLFNDETLKPGDTERLLALLAYKALFPRDFELLQIDQGYVNALLRSRAIIIENLCAQNLKEVAALEEELLNEANLRDPEALRMRIEAIEGENLKFSRKTLSTLLEESEDSDSIFNDPPYSHGFTSAYLGEVTSSPHFPLIQFLLRRGWIDETHERFMSNFYSDSISVRDREFLMGIFQGKPARSAYTIENPNAVLGRLDADTLSWSNAKNFALLTYLIHHGPKDKLKAIFTGLRHDKNISWLMDYSESESFDGEIFSIMEDQIQGSIVALLEDETIPVNRRRNFAHRLLAFGLASIEDEAIAKSLKTFAEDDLEFLLVCATKPMKIADGLEKLGYHPNDLATDGVSKKLLRFVFDKGLFEPTAPFLDSLTAALIDAGPAMDSGYLVTRLYNLDDETIRGVVEANPTRFVETLLENTNRNLAESGEAIAWLLNCEGLSDAAAKAYIKAIGQSTQIEAVNIVESPALKAELMDTGHVIVSKENILDYFASIDFTIDEHLAKLLNSNPFPAGLTMRFAEEHLGDESGFLTSLIESPLITDDKLEEIVRVYRAQFNNFAIEGLSDERIGRLILQGTIRVTEENLNFIRTSNPHRGKYFAIADLEAYLYLVLPREDGRSGPCEFLPNEALEIFQLDEIDERAKLMMLDAIEGPVALEERYPCALNAAIATKHFDPREDITKIAELYSKGDRKLKRALAEAFVDQQLDASQNTVKLSMDMMADIAWRMRNERQEMLGFIAGQLDGRDPAPSRYEVRTVFERANLKEYVELIDGPTAVIPQSASDDRLLEVLANMGMAGKQVGKVDWQGQRRINSKGFSRA